MVTYLVMLMLIFFSMQGYLPGIQDEALNSITGQLYQLFVWLIGLAMMHRSFKSILHLAWKMKSFTALALLAPISCLWSQFPANSLRRGMFLILSTMFAFYLMRRFTPVQVAQMIVMAGIATGILALLTCIAAPHIGIDPEGNWQGPFEAKNNCAQVMLFFLTAAVPITFPTRGMNLLRYLLFFLASILIVMSRAKTSWLLGPAFFFLMGIAAWLRRVKRRDATILVLGLLAALVCFAALIPYLLPLALDILGKDANLTGRVPLWQSVIVSILKHPLLGYGYAAFWMGMQGESFNVFMGAHFLIGQAQNGILEVWLELGFVGVVLAAATLLGAMRNALVCFQHEHSPVVNWYIGVIALSVAYNFDETFVAMPHSIGWFSYMIACTGLAIEASRIRAVIKRSIFPVASIRSSLATPDRYRFNASPLGTQP